MLRHARRMLQDEDTAKDIIQDVFVHFWEKRLELTSDANLSYLLYKSLRFRVLDAIDKAKVRANYMDSLAKFATEAVYTTDERMAEMELKATIEQEVALLPQKMREVFELSRFAEKSYKEISEELQVSENTVKKQISNALGILRKKLR